MVLGKYAQPTLIFFRAKLTKKYKNRVWRITCKKNIAEDGFLLNFLAGIQHVTPIVFPTPTKQQTWSFALNKDIYLPPVDLADSAEEKRLIIVFQRGSRTLQESKYWKYATRLRLQNRVRWITRKKI